MKKVLLIFLCIIICVSFVSCDYQNIEVNNSKVEKQLLYPGEVFETGKFIDVEGVQISYDGTTFFVQNNRTNMVRILCSIVGVKKDGTYDTIQLASFVGIDKTQYEKDKLENGWAIEQYTNLIRPNETLEAKLEVFDFNNANSDYPKNDIDNDGYLDIMFTISPQEDEKTIMTSTDDYKSETYKIKLDIK